MVTGRERAIALRRAGRSRSQIAAELGIRSPRQLNDWLRGEPPPAWTARPRAKDELRDRAIALRQQGRSYREIAEEVPASKSTLSLWLRDVPMSDEHRARLAERSLAGREQAAESLRARRQHREEAIKAQARAEIGELTDRELFIAGVVAYWAEGAKAKPWNTSQRVDFVNSDVDMIRLFMAWLCLLDIGADSCSFRVAIHESADVGAAITHWSGVVGVPAERFAPPSIKRHSPKTKRKNTGSDYHGCLIVRVRASVDLNRRVAGWWGGIAATVSSRHPIGTIGGRSGMVQPVAHRPLVP